MAKAEPIPDAGAETPFCTFAASVIEIRAREVSALLAHPGRNGGPPDVHDLRVAIRRLRTALEVFQPVLPKRAKAVRRELKAAFAALGPRRDADVAVQILRELEPELAAADLPGWRTLLASLETEAPAGTFDSAATLRAAEEAALLATGVRDRDASPAGRALRDIAGRRVAAVEQRLAAFEDAADVDALHDLRLAAKRLRYGLEAAAPVLGEPAAAGARAARRLQNVLGDLHDCELLLPRVREHRRALREADVAALRGGGRPPNATRYRGVQAVDSHVRARRARLREKALVRRSESAAALEAVGSALRGPA